jgi:S-adenosylmethionine:tRNA ribosyltransferase-isomerase
MRTSDLDYHLPPDHIAVAPAEPRDTSRLLVVQPGGISHHIFKEIGEFLRAGDLLVVNNTRVVPAKLLLRRPTGSLVAGLFMRELEPGYWEVMLRTRGRGRSGQSLAAGDFSFQLEERLGEGLWRLRVIPAHPAAAVLDAIGHVPLPPYISRQRKHSGQAEETPADRQWYQTVYARAREHAGSVAAPTAGLHFTPDLIARLDRQGIALATVDLEVGLGTFLPVEAETLEEHPMHTERFHVPASTVASVRAARRENRRIVAVGTTAVRTLEAAADQILDTSIPAHDLDSQTNLLIAPGFRFRLTDALITNFHLPKSTLMALVAAILGTDGVTRLKAIYSEAIQNGYRFYSYGDAMLILPDA